MNQHEINCCLGSSKKWLPIFLQKVTKHFNILDINDYKLLIRYLTNHLNNYEFIWLLDIMKTKYVKIPNAGANLDNDNRNDNNNPTFERLVETNPWIYGKRSIFEKIIRDKYITDQKCFKKLHPRRRRLWVRFSPKSIVSRDDLAILCGHCYNLFNLNLLENGNNQSPSEYYSEEDWIINNYQGNPIKSECMEDAIFLGDKDNLDEYHTSATVLPFPTKNESRKECCICWQFFISKCGNCEFDITMCNPIYNNKKFHCLGCYYFEIVLNQLHSALTLSHCGTKCMDNKWNKDTKQWPFRRIEPKITDFCIYSKDIQWSIIVQESDMLADEIYIDAQAGWNIHSK
jgi:hypothetical protein